MSHILRIRFDIDFTIIPEIVCDGNDCDVWVEDQPHGTPEEAAANCWFRHAVEEVGLEMLELPRGVDLSVDYAVKLTGRDFDDPIIVTPIMAEVDA